MASVRARDDLLFLRVLAVPIPSVRLLCWGDAQQGQVHGAERPTWHRLESPNGFTSRIELPNGDHVAVVEPWQFPLPLDGITTQHMHAVREKARTGEWRKDSKSDEWIGHVVAEILGLDTENEDDLNKIKAILKTWFGNKVLDTATRKDDHRKQRQFVIPGNWNEDSL